MTTNDGIVISGTGTWFPEPVITNDDLCAAFNEWVRRDNQRNAAAIAAGDRAPLLESSADFIYKASGIRQRHVVDRDGILDPDRMCPRIPSRRDDELCVQAELAAGAAERALAAAGREGADVDMLVVACAMLQRSYPAIGMEVQRAIGARGFALDMSVGCSSSTFPIQFAVDTVRAGNARCAVIINPELTSPFINWRDRDSHFIFGDGAVAVVIEREARAAAPDPWRILSTRLYSQFSSNIRNNCGFVNRCEGDPAAPEPLAADKLFTQQGRRVYKDIVGLAPDFIRSHVDAAGLRVDQVQRLWLHQANCKLNDAIVKRVLGRAPEPGEAPLVLDRYANLAAAGSLVAFDEHRADLPAGAHGVISSFGAGYSIGSVIVQRC